MIENYFASIDNTMLTGTDLLTAKVSPLAIDLFCSSLDNYIDYNKPDPIARRQLESWKMNWSEGNRHENNIAADAIGDKKDDCVESVEWSPENYIIGTLEICGDYVAVTLEMECIWADGDAAKNDDMKEDGRLSYTCRLKSCRFVEKKDKEEKAQRKIRKKMISRMRQDSYIAKLLGLGEENKLSTKLCLARASIYVNATKFELEERVDVSEIAAETLRRALWPSTASSLDVVEVILALPSLPCRSTDRVTTTTRLANRAKLRLLEDAMLDECEKEGEDQLIEDLNISKPIEYFKGDQKEQARNNSPPTTRKNKKPKR